jgi:hypothetical protein
MFSFDPNPTRAKNAWVSSTCLLYGVQAHYNSCYDDDKPMEKAMEKEVEQRMDPYTPSRKLLQLLNDSRFSFPNIVCYSFILLDRNGYGR